MIVELGNRTDVVLKAWMITANNAEEGLLEAMS